MNPAGLCNPEFSTMCSEKLVVANRAVAAMVGQSGGIQRAWTEFWFQQMQRSWAAAPQFAGSLTPGRFMQAAAISAGTLLSDWMALGATIAKVSEAMADAAAKPVRLRRRQQCKSPGKEQSESGPRAWPLCLSHIFYFNEVFMIDPKQGPLFRTRRNAEPSARLALTQQARIGRHSAGAQARRQAAIHIEAAIQCRGLVTSVTGD